MLLSSLLSQLCLFSQEHVGSVGPLLAGEGSYPRPRPDLAEVGSLSGPSRDPAQPAWLKVRVRRSRGQPFVPFLGIVSTVSWPHLMANFIWVCGVLQAAASWLLLQEVNVWCVLQQCLELSLAWKFKLNTHLQQKDNARRGKRLSCRR